MNTKRLILNVVVMVSVILLWQGGLKLAYHYHPEWKQPAAQTDAPNPTEPTPAPAPVVTQTAVNPATGPAVASPAGTGVTAVSATDTKAVVLGSEKHDDAQFSMSVRIDPRGAGLDGVLLNQFYAEANKPEPFSFQQPVKDSETLTRPLATRWIKINGQGIDVSAVNWKLLAATASTATYQGDVTDGGKPLVRITKTFTVTPRYGPGGKEDPTGGYEVAVDQTFTNLGAVPLKVEATINGPSVPERQNLKSEDRQYVAGFDKGFQTVETAHTFVSDLAVDKPAIDVAESSDKYPFLWAGCCNSYFDAIVLPDYVLDPKASSVRLASVTASGIARTKDSAGHDDTVTALTMTTAPFDLAPGGSTPFKVHAFFGPKSRKLLKDDQYCYHGFPRGYDGTLIYVSRFCGFVTFSWLINLLYWLLSLFHLVLRDWGMSIILLVCCVRLMLHPITKRAQVNMMRMSKMGPEIERLKKKYGDDKEQLNKAMWEVTRENGVGGALGCLPMFLQTPIWIALYSALNSTFELRHAPFLYFGHFHLTWIGDLSAPDALIGPFQHAYKFLFFEITSINLLPLLMAVVTYTQMALQPVPANMTPEQEQQRKMQKWMSLIVPVFLYNGPSGLNLYILTSSTLGLVEQKIIRDHIKAQDEAEKAGKVIVDTRPTRGGKWRDPIKVAKPESWLSRKIQPFVEKIQAQMEQAKREAERRNRGQGPSGK